MSTKIGSSDAEGTSLAAPVARSAGISLRGPILLHLLITGLALALAFGTGGADAIWVTSATSGHDGMQNFRVAIDLVPEKPITDNSIRYGRILYPAAANIVARLFTFAIPATVAIPGLDDEVPGAFLAVAWSLLLLAILAGARAVREVGLLLGKSAAWLAAVSPMLLLGETHCLDFPFIMLGTFRFFRMQGAGAPAWRLALLAAILALVHPAALILAPCVAITPWLDRQGSMRARVGALMLACAALLPLLIWSVWLWQQPGFADSARAGADTYANAAFRFVPLAGMADGIARNWTTLLDEIAARDWLGAGARIARHSCLLLSALLFAIAPFIGRRVDVQVSRAGLHVYWALGVVLLMLVDWQVTAELDNLGRFLLASPLVFLAIIALDARGPKRTAFALAMALALAVDCNYLYSFWSKVNSGGAALEAGRSWWFR